jgi:hypothetical protein
MRSPVYGTTVLNIEKSRIEKRNPVYGTTALNIEKSRIEKRNPAYRGCLIE